MARAPMRYRTRTARIAAAGFSLIEMLTSVTVVAIFMSIASGPYYTMVCARRANAAASAIVDSLWMARSEAMRRNSAVGFTFADIGAGWNIVAGTTVLKTQEPFVNLASGAGSFQFNAFGRLTAGAGNIEVTAVGTSVKRCVSITTTGRATVQSGACP